ncbi:MAG: FtsX-like permease family protein [Actinobacteria bacterium]|nr:FtsX-like permease family protein [Actinomycetota bacterium]
MRANFVMSGVREGIRRNLLMTIALVLTTAVSLSFVAAAILTGVEIHRFSDQYQGKLNVSIYLCDATTGDPCRSAISNSQKDDLQQKLTDDPQIRSVSYVSQQDAYNIALKTLDPSETQFMKVGDLPASFTLKLKNISRDYNAVQDRYKSQPGVYQINNENETLKTILQLFSSGLLAAIIAAAVVLVCAIILIAITIQVAAAQRRNETNIMRLVGASRLMTQLPFMIEGVIAAAVGGLVSLGVAFLGKWYVLDGIFKTEVARKVLPDLTTNDVIIAGGISLLAGIVLAGITAYITLRLYVRL